MNPWSATQYLKFEDERSRPARDLLARVPLTGAATVVDLGCGPGNSTELVAARFPEARIIGVDNSPDMLAAARRRLPHAHFIDADVATWSPYATVNLIFANAVFHWVAGHLEVMRRLMETLAPRGVLAVQMPDNLNQPSHMLMQEIAATGPWSSRFVAPIARETIRPTADYYDALRPRSAHVDIWRTTYHHPLADAGAIVDWMTGSGLRPYLDRLDKHDRTAFLLDYKTRLAEAYPPRSDGQVLLPFPRLFVVAISA
jgi:trans-aconitate 2-methyltransferase